MNFHKLGGFKQHTLIILKRRRVEIQQETCGAQTRVSEGLAPSWGAGESPLPCQFLVAASLHSLAPGHITSSSVSCPSVSPSHLGSTRII